MAALALVVLLEWTWPGGGMAAPGAALRLPHGSQKTPSIERETNAWAATILARPLFSASRKPPRVASGTHDEAAPDEARLAGIMIGQFGRRAIFAPSGGGKPQVLGEGAEVNESTIRSIEPDRVVLASGAVLRPEFDKNRVPTAYAPPFQPPFQPPMPNGTFPNSAGPQPNFAFPRIPQFQPPQADQAQPGAPDGQPSPAPMFRGPLNPNRRE
jgi:hypothetical protein